MLRARFLHLAMGAMLCANAIAGEPGAAARSEVDQLLTRLAASGCQFQRNGHWHTAAQAREHLEKKFEYLLKKDLVATSEDFIARGAAASSSSGKPYLVKCGAQAEVTSAVWMTAQLKEVRAKARGRTN
jgi:hypothetical protein